MAPPPLPYTGGAKSQQSDLGKIVRLIMERNYDPVIIFSFSKRCLSACLRFCLRVCISIGQLVALVYGDERLKYH